MLATFFHDRQIEQDLVERIQAITLTTAITRRVPTHFQMSRTKPAFSAPKAACASRAKIEKKSFCDMDAGYSMWKSA
jgi:hypothetical protein